ncbi:MAG: neutral/alkaline non-lysosomal ceramidase N-terminal domain-containing protein [Elusimicrobiota bacterium]
MDMMPGDLAIGVAKVDVTPDKSLFLFGYPHVKRYSTGVNDPLYASVIAISDLFHQTVIFCSVDIIFITKNIAARVREIVTRRTGIPASNINIAATHTHSGPMTVYMLSNMIDPQVPKEDKQYVDELVNKTAEAIIKAYKTRIPAELAVTVADGTGVGGNRRIKGGITDPEVPVVIARDIVTKKVFGVMIIYCMHPTILHEDSTKYSSDFPGYTRMRMNSVLGRDVVVVYHTGPEGNQSPRYFAKSNTFDEAKRVGYILGDRIVKAVKTVCSCEYTSALTVSAVSAGVPLKLKKFMTVKAAQAKLEAAHAKLDRLRAENAPHGVVRTAEVDWFGAEETLSLARISAKGIVKKRLSTIAPGEVMVVRVGQYLFITFPGEFFVEYSLEVKKRVKKYGKAYVIALSNGELQGYMPTKEAFAEGGYEASNSIFSPSIGEAFVKTAVKSVLKAVKK